MASFYERLQNKAMEKKEERNEYVDFLRGIAMLMVVLGHTLNCTQNSENSFLNNVIWSLQMPLFVLISGYVTRYSARVQTGTQLWHFIKKRTLAYVLPWVSWTFLVRGLILGQAGFLDFKRIWWKMDSGYWFLCTIWTISIVHGLSQYLSSKLVRKKETLGERIQSMVTEVCIYAGFMIILLCVGMIMGVNFLCIKLTLYYMPFYIVGCLIGAFQDDFFALSKSSKWMDGIIAISFAVYLFILIRVNLFTVSGMGVFYRVIASFTGCAVLCALLMPLNVVIQNGKSIVVNVVKAWGVHSLEIYLAHYLVLNLIKMTPAPDFISSSGIALVCANYLLTILLVSALVWLLNQNRYLKFVLFGKRK